MQCERCSTELPNDAVACYRCGMAIDATFVRLIEQYPPSLKQNSNRWITLSIIGLLSVIAIVAFIYVGAYIATNKDNIAQPRDNNANRMVNAANVTAANTSVSLPPPMPLKPETPLLAPVELKAQTVQIFNGEIVVSADSSRSWTITVGPLGGRIVGNFRANGGLRGEISCYIAPADEKENLSRGLQSKIFYDSGKVHDGKIDTVLKPGQYVVMFRNDSPWTHREVSGKIDLIQ